MKCTTNAQVDAMCNECISHFISFLDFNEKDIGTLFSSIRKPGEIFAINESFSTLRETKIKFKMLKYDIKRHISIQVHITIKTSYYNIIFGRNLLWEIGIELDFQNNIIRWKDIIIPIK